MRYHDEVSQGRPRTRIRLTSKTVQWCPDTRRISSRARAIPTQVHQHHHRGYQPRETHLITRHPHKRTYLPFSQLRITLKRTARIRIRPRKVRSAQCLEERDRWRWCVWAVTRSRTRNRRRTLALRNQGRERDRTHLTTPPWTGPVVPPNAIMSAACLHPLQVFHTRRPALDPGGGLPYPVQLERSWSWCSVHGHQPVGMCGEDRTGRTSS